MSAKENYNPKTILIQQASNNNVTNCDIDLMCAVISSNVLAVGIVVFLYTRKQLQFVPSAESSWFIVAFRFNNTLVDKHR